jgi:hypothetical protein
MTRVFSRSQSSKDLELSRCKEKAKETVNKKMDEIRSVFITPIAGQDMIYMAKEKEATAFLLAASDPTATPGWEQEYPFIAGEVGSTGQSAYEVVQVFLNLAAQWKYVGAQLEKARIEAIQLTGSAQTEAEVDAVMDLFHTTMAAYG